MMPFYGLISIEIFHMVSHAPPVNCMPLERFLNAAGLFRLLYYLSYVKSSSMLLHGTLSAYLRDTSGSFSDPWHGHSFSPVQLDSLSPVDRNLVVYRACVLCQDRLLCHFFPRRQVAPVRAAVAAPKGSKAGLCQCLNCSHFIHRACASFSHFYRNGSDHESLMPRCTQAPPLTETFGEDRPSKTEPKRRNSMRKKAETFTLATLIEELDSSKVAASGVRAAVGMKRGAVQRQPHQVQTASKVAKKLAPFLAVGGVVGAIAMGPAAGVMAGLNMLVASVGAETVMAGIGLTASAAAAATVTHQNKVKTRERLRKGEWAMEICWNCKKHFTGAPSDEACRKDAEFLRRFQLSNPRHCQVDKSEDAAKEASSDEGSLVSLETVPDDADVYRFLFSIFASPGELLGQMNVQLCEAFRKRFTDRHRTQVRRPSFTGMSNSAKIVRARTLAKDTLHDTKMYIAHVLGATLQCFPSLASTSQSVSSCTLAIERIIYDDIHAMVFGEFQRAFEEAESAFANNLRDIRLEQKYHSSTLLQLPHQNEGGGQHAMLAEDLQKAETKMVAMMQETSSPLLKLVLLCDAFRSICCFAERLHQSASNTDMLIPILCAFLVQSPRVCHGDTDFVAEIAFISFFTNGGGKGVEGYVLTTLQAAIQVIAAVDLTSGHAMELDIFIDENESEATDEVEDDDDEFFDAVSSTTRESQL